MISIQEIKKAILSLSKQKKEKQMFEDFLDSFFSYISFEDLDKKRVEELHKIADLSYSVFMHKTKDRSIRIFVGKTNEVELKNGEAILVILNKDMPFLVDSITEYLNRQKYLIQRIVNSTFNVVRSKDGVLSSIDNTAKDANESLIYIKLSNVTSCVNLSTLKEQCENVLTHVHVAVRDWKKMSEDLQRCIDNFIDFEQYGTQESRLFLEWALSDNFIFVGSKEYIITDKSFKSSGNSLGVCSLNNESLALSIKEDILEANDFKVSSNKLLIGRVKEISNVHRAQNLDYFCIVSQINQKEIRVNIFLGLFVSRLSYQSVSTIPIIRQKVKFVVDKSRFLANSFNAKELFGILEALPKKDFLQMSNDELFDRSMTVLSCITHPRLVLFIRKNSCGKFVDVEVLFPRKRVESETLEKVQCIVSEFISGVVVESSLNFFSIGLASINISIIVDAVSKNKLDIDVLEAALDNVTSKWSDNLGVEIENYFGSHRSGDLIEKYAGAFSNNYAFKFSLNDAINDISSIETMLLKNEKFLFKLYSFGSEKTSCWLRIYGLGQKVELHQIMPIFDNLGFYGVSEDLFDVVLSTGQKICIQHFVLRVDAKNLEQLQNNKSNIEEAISAIFYGTAKNDLTNKLICKADLSWRQVFLLNSYCKYLLQIKFVYSQDFIKETLVKHSNLSKLIIRLFDCFFNPSVSDKDSSDLETKIKISLSKITSTSEDKVMRKFVEVIKATLRTNYFQTTNGAYKDYVSLKIDSAQITDIPLPKPFAEIFVYSLYMEGIHLRGGKISRGGIRWSDRSEDYRTEVLGLMKSQMTKNTIIVPDGAKGGYVIKSVISEIDKDKLFLESIRCYKTFLRGILDITDNLYLSKVKKPDNVVCRDGDDPYLVVAADKGTATFSDIANTVAKDEYQFWLGDAFASGGTAGYDHKEMAITARGAWVSVEHHFNSIGLDPNNDIFTVVGIGDMSGDVFGNGLLLSNKMKLIAAFNHMHIFIDPNPNPNTSYKERKRLFKLPRSTWNDYDKRLISHGGGVFERNAKHIKLSKEIKDLLLLAQDQVEPDALIKAILKAKVDLIWNGGIGTYVKSCNENNADIGNKSNDEVRVDALDLGCKVFAEGGNLGVTQLGRVEFAFNGGHINTDFIDNSGGVDCSDHEVNIKIALNNALFKKKITHEERDVLLVNMKSDVADLVLYDNKAQNQNLSIDNFDNVTDLYSYVKLVEFLEKTAGLNPKIEFLPSKAELSRRKQDNLGLSRPELAVLMAYSKRSVYDSVVGSKIPDDDFYQQYLFDYFPHQMIEKFSDEIRNHPLKREIIANGVANDFINHLGVNFYHNACEVSGLSGCDVIRAFSVAWQIFALKELWHEISLIKDFYVRIDLYAKLRLFVRRVIFWLLGNQKHPINISEVVNVYKKSVEKVQHDISSYLSPDLKAEHNLKLQDLKAKKIPEDLALKIANLDSLYYVLDVVLITYNTKYNFIDMLTLYFEVGEEFYYNWLNGRVDSILAHGYWDRMLIKSLKDDIDLQHRLLVIDMVKSSDGGGVIKKWKANNIKKVDMFSVFIKSVMSLEELDYSKLVIAVKHGNILLSSV